MAKVMLVEDDNNLREIYEARLAAEGYEIVSAHDGEEALALAVKEKPDLIISDVMMPKISGFDMLDILRGTPETQNAKVIMMTALGQAEDRARADKLGADRYLVKSQVTLEDVIKVVQDILNDGSAPVAAPAAAPAPNPAADQSGPTPVVAAPPVAAPAPAPEPVATPAPEPAAEPVPAPVPVVEPPAPVEPPVAPAPAPEPPAPEPIAEPAPEPEAQPTEPTMAAKPVTAIPVTVADEQVQPEEEKPEEIVRPTPKPISVPVIEEEAKKDDIQDAPAAPEVPVIEPTNIQTEAEEASTAEQQIQDFVASNPTLSAATDDPDEPMSGVKPHEPPSHKKLVLQPTGNSDKPAVDLDALLAKEGETQPTPPPQTDTLVTPAGPDTDDTPKVDPSQIAL